MFIKRSYKKVGKKNYSTVLLTHGFRENGKVKHKTLANMSSWPEDLVSAIEKIIKGGKFDFDFENMQSEQGKSFGALYTLSVIADRLGITKAFGKSKEAKLCLAMILGRILNQGSRLSLVSWQKDQSIEEVLKIPAFNEDQLYYAMDWLDENNLEIEKKIFKSRYHNETPTFYLYDVTSSYFEGEMNELAKYGYNRDGKKGKKQIVIGLLADGEGMPIAGRVFEGNTQDPKTVETQIELLAKEFGVKNLVFVGDRGMIKREQQKQISSKEDWYFITAVTKPEIEKMLSRNLIQMELFTEDLGFIEEAGTRLIFRRNPIRQSEIRKNRTDIFESFKNQIEKKNQYLQEHLKAKATTSILHLTKWIKKRNLENCVLIKEENRMIRFEIDKDKVEKLEKLDGCYVIKTNVPTEIATEKEIHDRYKDLKHVENNFRNLKTFLLEVRPIFHRKAARTKALVNIAVYALMIIKYLERETDEINLTTEYKIKTLEKINYWIFNIGSHKVKQIPKILKEDQTRILKKLKITLPIYLDKRML